jgi:hypothetical protein
MQSKKRALPAPPRRAGPAAPGGAWAGGAAVPAGNRATGTKTN